MDEIFFFEFRIRPTSLRVRGVLGVRRKAFDPAAVVVLHSLLILTISVKQHHYFGFWRITSRSITIGLTQHFIAQAKPRVTWYNSLAGVGKNTGHAETFPSFSVSGRPFFLSMMFQAFRLLLTVSFHRNFGIPLRRFPSIIFCNCSDVFSFVSYFKSA